MFYFFFLCPLSNLWWSRKYYRVEVREKRHTHIRPQWLKVQFQWPWVSVSAAPTPSKCCGLVECEPFSLGLVSGRGEGWYTARHPILMDEEHYGSWGQVPQTIKGPSQWFGKNGSRERREEGKENCCRRTSKHKPCRESRCETSGEVEGNEWVRQVENRQMGGVLFFAFKFYSICDTMLLLL